MTRVLHAGSGAGELVVLSEPLSLWGGMDRATGRIVDRRHPQCGRALAGKVVAMPSGRGSSSSSSVLAEALRAGTGPAALLLREPDGVLAVGAIVAAELYGVRCPVVVLDPGAYDRLESGAQLRVEADDDGGCRVTRAGLRVRTVDYHTAGEPFRVVLDGAPDLPGATVLERRDAALAVAEPVRRLLVNEPRGHADMYGGFVTPPDDAGAAFGVVFFHKDGYSTACGHGTIALARWAVDTGRAPLTPDGEAPVVIDVPSGRVTARARSRSGRVVGIAFRNVPSYVAARRLVVETSAGPVRADLSYGGAFYASVRASELGLAVCPEHLPDLIRLGREVKWALNERPEARHPSDARLSGVYGTILYDELEATDAGVHQRNVTVFADGEVDRSPCGSGTSARLALLADEGALGAGETLVHDSVIGTRFLGRIVDRARVGGREAVVTEVEGNAHRTGTAEFVLEEDDELGTGFQLR